MKNFTLIFICIAFSLSACKNSNQPNNTSNEEAKWEQLFNGKDLEGWTVKICNYPAGENFANTFRVEDGIMKVSYDGYDNKFDSRFGHIYTNKSYSHYKLRVEYRFVGEQIADGPGWAYRNSGAMLHAQAPETMAINQDFPISIEAQMLGGNGTDERTTGNVCTPGTTIHLNGELATDHCYSSTSKTYHGDQWVTMEMVVLGDSIIHHIIEGDTIMTYGTPRIGGGNVSPTPNIPEGALKEGRIALQSESNPVEFRKIELLDLSGKK